MASVNKVIVMGNIGKDPEQRSFPDGSPVTNISVACTEKYKDKQGEQKEVTEWVNVVFFGKLAEIAGQYLAKGSAVYVEGKLKTEKYTDKNGIERWTTKVVANNMQMIGGKPGESTSRAAPTPQSTPMDDDIPF